MMQLNRAEKARLVEIETWLAKEQVAARELHVLLDRMPALKASLDKALPGAFERATGHIDLPLSNLAWLLKLVKREASR